MALLQWHNIISTLIPKQLCNKDILSLISGCIQLNAGCFDIVLETVNTNLLEIDITNMAERFTVENAVPVLYARGTWRKAKSTSFTERIHYLKELLRTNGIAGSLEINALHQAVDGEEDDWVIDVSARAAA